MEKTSEKGNIFLRIFRYIFPQKGDKPAEIIRKIIFLAAVITLIVTLTILITAQIERVNDNNKNKELSDLYHGAQTSDYTGTDASKVEINVEHNDEEESSDSETPEIQDKFLPLLEINDDIVGWITISNNYPFIDYPVLQYTDNKYYLSHNFYGEPSRSGALYMDFRNHVGEDGQSANLVLYGHNMASGEYFAQITNYFNYAVSLGDPNNIDFYKRHPTLTFSTLYKTSTYKIFAGILTNTQPEAGEVFYYHNVHDFANKSEFDNFCAEVLDRSTFITPDVDLQYGDNLITLSTCMLGTTYGATDLRWVLFAREVREGEDETVDVSKAYSNPSPKFYDLYYQTRGGKWEGRGWKENIIKGYDN